MRAAARVFDHMSGVAPLFDPLAIQNGDWERIAKNAEIVMANVREVGPFVRKWERAWRERLWWYVCKVRWC